MPWSKGITQRFGGAPQVPFGARVSGETWYSGRFNMKIDLFNHFFPKPYFDRFIDTGGIRDIGKRVRNIQAIWDVEFRFKVMDEIRTEFGDYCQVLTLPAPHYRGRGWTRQVA